jgi:hypothetical protein
VRRLSYHLVNEARNFNRPETFAASAMRSPP